MTIKVKEGKAKPVTLVELEFDNEKIGFQSEEVKEKVRNLWKSILDLRKNNEIIVDVKSDEAKETLNDLRKNAIVTWKIFYKSFGLGEYQVSAKDAQITLGQAKLVLDEVQLRKYFESDEWFTKPKLLYKYCSSDIQNALNQSGIEKVEKHPLDWSNDHYNKLKTNEKRTEYIQYLKSLGYVKKSTESGVLCYVKTQNPSKP